MRQILRRVQEAASELRVALAQTIPSDDQVIVGRVREALRMLELELLFACRVCGKECDVAPDPPDRAVCPEHCEDHEYRYEKGERRDSCTHCGQDRPEDW